MCLLILISMILSPGALLAGHAHGANHGPAASRTFEITYAVEVTDIPPTSKRLDLWIPYPIEGPCQEVSRFHIDSPYTSSINMEPKYGNRMVYFSIRDPSDPFKASMSYLVRRIEDDRGSLGRKSRDNMGWTLEPARLIPLTPTARQIALSHTDPNADSSVQARDLYEHTISYMTYDKSGTGWGHGDFQYACDAKRGNCTDYHSYFIGLCRNIGIPTYFEIGYSIPREKMEAEITGYHCWAYFWDGNEWMPVDISEADKHPDMKDYFFGHHDANRVAMSRGRDITLSPPQHGQPLNYFVFPYAEVDGATYDGITLKIHYKETSGL